MAINDAIQYRKFVDGIGVDGSIEIVSIACMVRTYEQGLLGIRFTAHTNVSSCATFLHNREALHAKAPPSCA